MTQPTSQEVKHTLNKKQLDALRAFARLGKPGYPSEAEVYTKAATCLALERRGLLKVVFTSDEMRYPALLTNRYRFEITEAGRIEAAISKAGGQ